MNWIKSTRPKIRGLLTTKQEIPKFVGEVPGEHPRAMIRLLVTIAVVLICSLAFVNR